MVCLYQDRKAVDPDSFDAFPTAKLAISIARKMNALIFLVPEDIVDVRPRLVSFMNFFPSQKTI